MENSINIDNILDKDTVDNIKKELLLKKDQILEELKSITGNTSNSEKQKAKFPDFGNKNDENAQEIDQYSTNLATENVLGKTLRDINSTLDRIEKGKYGICKYCGKEIGKKRMLARPVASACVECKTKLQNG
jgi:DnaK suppressor protein